MVMSSKTKFQRIMKILIIIAFALCNTVLIVEALIPGTSSASQSNKVSDQISHFLDSVTEEETIDIDPTALNFTNVQDEYSVGQKCYLTLEFTPANASNRTIVWNSSDDAIASISSNGLVKFIKAGQVTLTATNPSTNVSVQKSVNVVVTPPVTLELTASSLTIDTSKSLTLRVSVTPTNATTSGIVWESSDPAIATCTNGTVYAKTPGIVTITATLGDLSDQIELTIVEHHEEIVYATGFNVTYNNQSIPDNIYVDTEYPMSFSFTPANTTDQNFVYSVDKPELLKIEGKTLTALKAGMAVLTIKSTSNTDLIYQKTLTILEVLPENLAFATYSTTMQVGNQQTLSLNYDNEPTYTVFTFHSSDETIATVDHVGVVSAKQSGTVTITVTCDDYVQTPITISFELTVKRQSFIKDLAKFRLLVRKGVGHFGAFLVLGIFTILTACFIFRKWYWQIVITVFWGIGIASLTEILQLITPGRAGLLSDVILDFSGFIVPVIFTGIILFSKVIFKKKKIEEEKI